MKKGLFYALALTGVFASSCSDHDNVYDPDYSKKQYEENWKDKMGDIDPNQTWSMAAAIKADVKLSEDAAVSFYYFQGAQLYNLGSYSLKSGSSTISLDIPQGVDKVYVMKDTEGSHQEVVASVSNSAIAADFTTMTSRASKGIWIHEEAKPATVAGVDAYVKAGFSNSYFATKEWTITNSGKIATVPCIEDEGNYDVIDNVIAELKIAEGNKTLEYLAKTPFSAVMQEDGPVSLVYVDGHTAANSAIGYFVTDNATETEMKAAPKYILIPSVTKLARSNEFVLTYYDENGKAVVDSEGRSNFPLNKHLHFFLLRGKEGLNLSSPYKINGKYQFYGDAALNKTVVQVGKEDNLAFIDNVLADFSTSTYATGFSIGKNGTNVLSFEDWPTQNSLDWNDFAFILKGEIEDLPSIDVKSTWTVAYEDLGNTDDFDFNDVVLRIDHIVSGQEDPETGDIVGINKSIANIYLCAAGGILETYVYYDDKQIGKEVHEAFGVSTTTMVNTYTSATQEDYPKFLGPIDLTGENIKINDIVKKLKIKVRGKGSEEYKIEFPEVGDVPQAICVHTPWAWPVERTAINVAYEGFNGYGTMDTWWKSPAPKPENVINMEE